MSSPMPPQGLCAVCFDPIEPRNHAVDEHSARWDVHRGECARKAGIGVTVEDSLARLTAGLDRREQVARAVIEAGGSPDWRVDADYDERVGFTDARIEGTSADIFMDWPGPSPAPVLEHIALNGPADTLRQVEALRRVIAALEELARLDHWIANDAREEIAEALASIYPDPTEEA